MTQQQKIWARKIARCSAAVFFVGGGLNHFRNPEFYQSIVPPGFGPPALMVILSGIAEIAGGIGLLLPPLRRWAGWGLIALLIAVFPANIFMAVYPNRIPHLQIPHWILWVRLPLQFAVIAWVWFASAREPANIPTE